MRATNTKHIHVPDAHNIDLRLLPHTLSLPWLLATSSTAR